MTLRSLRLQRFGRFRDAQWEFAPGLNVIRGPNEAGKSTMREAIVRFLFDPQTIIGTTSKSFLAMRTWGETRDFALSGTFETEGRAFELTKDFEADTIELREGDTVVTDPGLVNERLAELVGAHSREVYETTACLRQQEFAQLSAGRLVSELLQQTLAGPGAEAGVQAVLDDLTRQANSLAVGLKGACKVPGPIKAAQLEQERLTQEISRLRPLVAAAEEARRQLEGLQERTGEIAGELTQAEDMLRRVERRLQLQRKLDDLTHQCMKLEAATREARRLQEQIGGLEAQVGEVADAGTIRRAEELERQIAGDEAEAGRVRERTLAEHMQREVSQARARATTRGILGGIGAALLIAGIIIASGGGSWGWGLGSVGMLLVIYALTNRGAGGSPMAEMPEGTTPEAAELQVQIERHRAELAAIVGDEGLDRLRARSETANGELNEARATLKGLLSGRSVQELDAEFSVVNADRRAVQDELERPELALVADMGAEAHAQLTARAGALRDEQGRIADEMAEARAASAQPEADPERLRSLEERHAAAGERVERLQERLAVIELTRELLDQAHRETVTGAIEVLEPRTAELLAALTCDRYERVEFDRGDLTPRVFSTEKGDWVELGSGAKHAELSCATREQVYLAARLALTELLWDRELPPIMLDDPFVNFDPERRRHAVEIVRSLAARAQVLLFTCDDLYDEYADRVIELTPG